MRRRGKAAGKAAKQRYKISPRRNAPKAAPGRRPIADSNEKVALLERRLDESLEQQKATSEVLQAISQSAFDLQSVFDTMVENVVRLCEAERGYIFRFDGKLLRLAASYNVGPEVREYIYRNPITPGRHSIAARAAFERRTVHIADVQRDPEAGYARAMRNIELFRTVLAAPMLKGDDLVGAILIYRLEVKPFNDRQVALVETFASQAVIAIENTRLLSELRQRTNDLSEALEQQTATSEVLEVISSSQGDLQPVFAAMLESAARLCDANFGNIFRWDGEALSLVATYNTPAAFAEARSHIPLRPNQDNPIAEMLAAKTVVHVANLAADKRYTKKRDPNIIAAVELGGVRTFVAVPMLKENELIGAVIVYRQEVRPFTDKQIELVKNFAAQAVIAIENTRLLNELHQRTDDLTEALEQQTATSEVLKVISSSPGELEPVFGSMLENAVRICEASFVNLLFYENDAFRHVALHNAPEAWAAEQQRDPVAPRHSARFLYHVAETKQVIQIADITAENPDEPIAKVAGARTLLIVPMLKENELIGAIAIYRQEVRPFTDKQIELVKNFAAQAVIAIENTRLLSELRESLQQQTATADVLKVISRSTFDLQTVLDTLLESAVRLSDARLGAMFRLEDGLLHVVAHHNFDETQRKFLLARYPMSPDRGHMSGRAILTGAAIQIPDILADHDYRSAEAKEAGFRSLLGVPLLRNGQAIGSIVIFRMEVGPFTDKQLELIQTFADQAVIAIENTRLLSELRKSLQQQTATADVLKVISRSAFDLKLVLRTLVESAARLCEAEQGIVTQRGDDGLYRLAASFGYPEKLEEYLKQNPLAPGRATTTGRVALEGRIVHIPDVLADPEYDFPEGQQLGGYRSNLGVPLLRDGVPIGAFVLTRPVVKPFTDKQIELVETFADQAVIAIENVRLLNELRESLQQQTATADVLKAISRSTFDLKTVLDALVEAAARLCEADQGTIARQRDGTYLRVATYGFSNEFTEYVKNIPVIPERGTATGRALLEGKIVHIPDVQADAEYTFVEAQKLGGFRTVLGVPMLREGTPIGVLGLTRHEVRPFTDKQIELVMTFADQAAIAIENVRLFESVEARTRQLAKSLDDLRTAQDRLVQTQKLASLGQLTAGIAHEIKNPLNFVNNFSSVSTELIDELQDTLSGIAIDQKIRTEIAELTDTLRGNLAKVVQHGKRADAIVKNMLLHSREGSGEHRPIDINGLVEESLNLAYHGARAEKPGFTITLQRSLDPTAGEVDVFPQDITRVLLNLISNGFYAATKRKAVNYDGYEPTLRVATRSLGDRVEISIRDNGTGIPLEVKEKLFTPFFTTKPAGEGTGLGLSISHDIVVKQHGGLIEVDTQPGEFTEFRIILPRGAATIAKSGERLPRM